MLIGLLLSIEASVAARTTSSLVGADGSSWSIPRPNPVRNATGFRMFPKSSTWSQMSYCR